MLASLSNKFDTMDSHLGGQLVLLSEQFKGLEEKVANLEADVDVIKKGKPQTQTAESTTCEDGVVGEKDESWLVQVHETSDGYPISCAVRNPIAKAKSCKPKAQSKDDLVYSKSTKRPQLVKLVEDGTSTKQKPISPKKATTTPTTLSDASDPIEDARNKAFDGALDKLIVLCKVDVETRKIRPKNLSYTQQDPFVGSLMVKRMLRGVKLSPTAYDPFAKADAAKVETLMNFIKLETEDPLRTDFGASNF